MKTNDLRQPWGQATLPLSGPFGGQKFSECPEKILDLLKGIEEREAE